MKMLSRRSFLNLDFQKGEDNNENQDKDILIFIFQRGAADGLNLVVPYADTDYYSYRPTIALPQPNSGVGSVLDLDGFFGLNPDLAALMPIYENGDLAFVHACGSQDSDHSHFSTQAFVDRGVVDDKISTGWMARYLNAVGNPDENPFQSVAINFSTPKSLKGTDSTVALNSIEEFTILAPVEEVDSIKTQILNMYNSDNDLDSVAQTTFSAIERVDSISPDDFPVENDAQYPDSQFANKLKDLALLIKSGIGIEMASVDIGGWDSHDSQAQMLQGLAQDYANSLSAFYTDLGDAMQNITVVTLTEFGRRVAENGSGGTDHGTGNVAFIMGGGVNGGQVYTDWPGLAAENQVGPGDLAATTDFRTILAEVFEKRLNFSDVEALFPEFEFQEYLGIIKNK